mmetsp:Transcript_62405/g.75099  ORF Transcript_62405/g.75099 Transcript_62405/m.75099 type:complete len:85 (-) Transcript_62405:74-328(-)
MMDVPDMYTIEEEDMMDDIGNIVSLLPTRVGDNRILVTVISTDLKRPETPFNKCCKKSRRLFLPHAQKAITPHPNRSRYSKQIN